MTDENVKIKVIEISYNRNGICGVPFHVVRFEWKPEDSKKKENFLATVFGETGACAVISLDRIDTCGIAFAEGNSWRGDEFENPLRKHIAEWEANR